MSTKPVRPVFTAALVALAAGLAVPPLAAREQCCATCRRPVVCEIELRVSLDGSTWRPLRGSVVQVPPGQQIELEVGGLDQAAHRFPQERMAALLEGDRNFVRLFAVQDLGLGRFRIRAGKQLGSALVSLWIPTNMNLDRELRFETGSLGRRGFEAAEAQVVAAALYRAILGREPDPTGLRDATLEIQRNNLNSLVERMFASGEYRNRARGIRPGQQLEQFYQALFDRKPDSGAVRTYLKDLERGRPAKVLLSLLRSPEFETQLLGHRP